MDKGQDPRRHEPANETASQSEHDSGDAALLCACENGTRGDLRQLVGAEPGISFEQVLERTGFGGRCTACLLDLEHYYVRFSTQAVHAVTAPGDAKRSRLQTSVPLKQRLYRAMDAAAPMVALNLRNVLPVLLGPGIEQYLVIANQSLLFEEEFKAPAMTATIIANDAQGRIVNETRETLAAGATLRRALVPLFDPAIATAEPGRVGIGSVTVLLRAACEGYRGTTRPQIEILTARGSCAVHGQDISRRAGGDVVLNGGDPADRQFLAFVSRERRAVDIELRYPQPLHGARTETPPRRTLQLPPGGAQLVELDTVPVDALRASAGLLRVSWSGTGCYSAHVLIADGPMERISIDHV